MRQGPWFPRRTSAVGLGCLGVLLVVSGCFDPFAGCGKVTTPNWEEPGLYEKFPQKGRLGDYAIRWLNGSLSNTREKEAEDQNLTNDSGIDGKVLGVNVTDMAYWSATRPKALDSEETRRIFDHTFEELGLGTHPNRPRTFSWRTGPC